MVNYTIKINKVIYHFSFEASIAKMSMTYDIGNQGPGMEQAQ
jgi:hypothetical protein